MYDQSGLVIYAKNRYTLLLYIQHSRACKTQFSFHVLFIQSCEIFVKLSIVASTIVALLA